MSKTSVLWSRGVYISKKLWTQSAPWKRYMYIIASPERFTYTAHKLLASQLRLNKVALPFFPTRKSISGNEWCLMDLTSKGLEAWTPTWIRLHYVKQWPLYKWQNGGCNIDENNFRNDKSMANNNNLLSSSVIKC